MPRVFSHLSALSEPTRARLLGLLEREELGVGELVRIVQLPQSTVSRHLKVLRVAGFVQTRREGTSHLFRLAPLSDDARALWTVVRDAAPPGDEDLRRLESVVAARRASSAEYFGKVAETWDAVRRELFGADFVLPALLGLLPPDLVVADLGCGTGHLAELLAASVGRVIAVDREEAMLAAARRRLADRPQVDVRRGELTALPLADGEADAALFVLVLHHVDDVRAALHEAARVVRPGGRVVVCDMVAHDRTAYRQTMGHVHLGFSEADLVGHLGDSGLAVERHRVLPPAPDVQGPGLFVATLRRP